MDAYAPPHSGYQVLKGGFWALVEHYPELLSITGNNQEAIKTSTLAINTLHEQLLSLDNKNYSDNQINSIFNQWLVGYAKWLD